MMGKKITKGKSRYRPKSKESEGKLLKLNLNECSLDLPIWLKHQIFQHLKKINWNRYPEEDSGLLTKLANLHGLKPANIIIGNGSNNLIVNLINAFGRPGQVIFFRPSFSLYSKMTQNMGLKYIEIPLNLEKGYESDIPTCLLKRASLIFIDSPNNPGGFTISSQKLREILTISSGLVVVDEAYAEFSEISFTSWVSSYSNLAILRTFSKAYRSAGVRFGYLISQKKNIERLTCFCPPFSVGFFPQTVASLVLDNEQMILKEVEKIKAERIRVFNELKSSKFFSPLPSQANFLLIKSHKLNNCQISRELNKRGIIVRIFDFPELKHFFRVTIGKRSENDRFLKALNEIEKEVNHHAAS
ncbi:MAG: pyridoxal phosphate-dependent aminotransferase [Candidatus Saccharicenans sp.]